MAKKSPTRVGSDRGCGNRTTSNHKHDIKRSGSGIYAFRSGSVAEGKYMSFAGVKTVWVYVNRFRKTLTGIASTINFN